MTPDDTAARDLAQYVLQRGLAPAGTALTVVELTGGVSGEVGLVTGPGLAVVVKRALARLDVQAVWTAKPERALTEAAALDVLHALTPEHTPQLLDVDAARLMFAMSAAPPDWRNWRTVLLDPERFDADAVAATANDLGTVLGTWHAATRHDAVVAARFADYEAFEQLRLTPFHRATAAVNPELAEVLLGCAAELLTRRDCLVHGDFSPKNVLVGDGVWVLDFEVAHVGAAVFDLAFMHSHLVLKALHRPERAVALARAAAALTASYAAATDPVAVPEGVARHTACLLLARLDGLSPAAYLTAASAARVRDVARRGLVDPGRSVTDLWSDVVATADPSRRRGSCARELSA